ncbi:hypothetical protein K491DRAFT_685355 [Lophiostoma macrostomum CBS 122681]|uniref:GPI anchored cell wall protein n=1 Tax=Lophiostoma macrostomum CBS 122681 TaxID=1314788 RepID=A0A6A6SIR7_9PLEO|nr:hypothetical protein K491DRAFT_685355 [Lophiostoma macrostomum CBS 122681]
MKTFTSVATLAVLLSSASAATVTLQETACLETTELETFTVETDKVVAKDLASVCGLKIVSVDGAETSQVTCQAFTDAEGTTPGSEQFTYTIPARISTNPVQEAAIRCNLYNPSNTATVSASVTVTEGTGGPSNTATVSASVTVIDGTTITVTPTATVSASVTVTDTTLGTVGTGSPTGSHTNGTVPTGTQAPTGQPTWNAASAAQIGAGALAAGFAALLL